MCLDNTCSIKYGECHCGCSGVTNVVKWSNRYFGHIKNEPKLYLNNHHKLMSPVQYVVNEETGCWDWQRGKDQDGYGMLRIDGKTIRAHIYFYTKKYGKIPDKLILDHFKCQNPSCCNPDHVEPVTVAENNRRGMLTKLDVEDITFIRETYADEVLSAKEISVRYKIGLSQVYRIINNQAWVGI